MERIFPFLTCTNVKTTINTNRTSNKAPPTTMPTPIRMFLLMFEELGSTLGVVVIGGVVIGGVVIGGVVIGGVVIGGVGAVS